MSDDKVPGLRNLFGSAPEASIDVAAVTRRSRARRLPKVLGIGMAGVLALGGVSAVGAQYALGDRGTVTAQSLQEQSHSGAQPEAALGSDSAAGMQSGYDQAKRSAASRINPCGAEIATPLPSTTGLELHVQFADAVAGSATVDGTVTLVNGGDDVVVGYTAAHPTITISQSDIVLWHTNGESTDPDVVVQLAPGESIAYQSTFAPVRCGIEDEQTAQFSDNLPALPAGRYQVSAAIDVMGDFDADLVMSSPRTIVLR